MTTEAKVEDRTVLLNGLNFHYRDWGNNDAQTLVLLHGFTGHARSWDTFARAFCDRYHILALDQRGHGESEWASDYAPDRNAEDMDAFVHALGLKRFALLGLSMGGRAAYTYAGMHNGPETVERLVILDIGPEIPAAGGQRIQDGVRQKDVFKDPEEAIAQARAANAVADEQELRARNLNNLMQTADGTWTWRYDKALRAPGRQIARPDPEAGWATLRRITAPTLLVRGAQSDVLSVETAERMVREIPDCRMVTVQNSGHSIPLDNPRGLIEAVQTFL
jgi:pimeloyl-ACP methyl ester carboxylesterase